jgi:hypothetical protein
VRGIRRIVLGALAVALLHAPTARGEVGVVYHDGRTDQTTLYLQTVVDEPDPFGIWFRHSDNTDLRRRVLNADGDDLGDGPPSIVYNAVWKMPVVVWSKNYPLSGERRIVISSFVDGAWQAPQPLNTLGGEQLDPFVTVGPGGSLHVVFWSVHDGQHGVYHQALVSRDDGWFAPTLISRPGEIACRPSAAIHQGEPRVVYEVLMDLTGEGPRDIVLAELSDAAIVTTVIATSTHDGPLGPQVHSNGSTLWVDWIDFTNVADTVGEMAWRKLIQQGDWSATRYETFDSEEQRDYHARGAIRAEALGLTAAGNAQPGEVGSSSP